MLVAFKTGVDSMVHTLPQGYEKDCGTVEVGITTYFLGPSLQGSYVDVYHGVSSAGFLTKYGGLIFSVRTGRR